MKKPKKSSPGHAKGIHKDGRTIHLAGEPKHSVWKPASAKTCADFLYQDDDKLLKGAGLSQYQRDKFIQIAGEEYQADFMERRKKETKEKYLERLLGRFKTDSKKTA